MKKLFGAILAMTCLLPCAAQDTPEASPQPVISPNPQPNMSPNMPMFQPVATPTPKPANAHVSQHNASGIYEHPDAGKASAAKEANADKAIDIVSKQKEVQAWVKQLEQAKKAGKAAGTASFMVTENKGNIFTVHAFENKPDYTATFNWYDVDIKTGKVSKQF